MKIRNHVYVDNDGGKDSGDGFLVVNVKVEVE